MSFFPELPLSRRRLTGLATVAATVPALQLATAGRGAAATLPALPKGTPADRPDRGGRYELRRDPGSVVYALDLPVVALPGTTRARGGLRTPVIHTTEFSMMGVTWQSGEGTVRARFRRLDLQWTGWRTLRPMHDGPDQGGDEAQGAAYATELVWTGRCDAVQLEIGGKAQAPVLALIDPGIRQEDEIDVDDIVDETEHARSSRRRKRVPKPGMRSRKSWGANPRLTTGRVEYNRTLRQVHIHHTVSSNDYRRRDVPAMIRGMYRYHTRSLGWSDIGYNFLVDRFGRIWVGRRGGVWRKVRGAHTLGFNETSVGIAVIGNYENQRPNDAIIGGISKLSAWKLWRHDGDPTGTVRVTSEGSDRFREGQRVRLPVIDGHRHTNETACPGQRLYDALPEIRRRAHRRIRKYTR